MTGIEDFAWDDKYVFGYNDMAEYEALKKDKPSFTDIYELKRFEELVDENAGILVKVKRVTDNRRFILDLAWLKAVDEQSSNFELLADYSKWFVNNK
ncbi:MAG: Calcium binding protein [Deltaproteobacteria bacterium]|nr:Calcium binding protein [Deltaproteobacteria bacterium]